MTKSFIITIAIIMFCTSHYFSEVCFPHDNNGYWTMRLALISATFLVVKASNYFTSCYRFCQYVEGLFYSFVGMDVFDRIIYKDANFHTTDLFVLVIPFIGMYVKFLKESKKSHE